ncbi:DnaT-like ssDNA-binding domain-containing protein [Kushneria sp. AK178]
MSLEAMAWARRSLPTLPSDVKTPARLALMLLADYAAADHVSWPSIKTMSHEMGCSSRSVQRAIDLLEQRGLLTVESRHDAHGRQRSNAYRLAVGGGCQFGTPTTSPESGEGDNLTPRGDTDDRGRVSPVSPLESTTENLTPSHSGADDANESDSIFERARHLDDSGKPLTAGADQISMSLDWVPDQQTLAVECQRRGLPMDTQHTAAELADFTAHFADTGKRFGAHAWVARFARWIHENRRREAARNQNTASTTAKTGDRHASRTAKNQNRAPIGRLSPAEARAEYERQQRERAQQPDAGQVFDGDFQPGDGGNH